METFIRKKEDIEKNKEYVKNMDKLAEKILNETILISNDQIYRICEIEFYLKSTDHKDDYTHGNSDQNKYGKWYFHKFSSGAYKGGTFKGLDITLGSDKEPKCYCGILIRALYNIGKNTSDNINEYKKKREEISNLKKDESFICGPSNSVSVILKVQKESTTSAKEFMKDKINPLPALKNKDNEYIYLQDDKNNILLSEKMYKGPRIGLKDTYPDWKSVDYRYCIYKNLAKKQKRSLKEF